MVKKNLPAKARRPRRAARQAAGTSLAQTLGTIEQLVPPTPQVAATLALFKSWLRDESGYDEETWPLVQRALERERRCVGARRLFDG